MVSKVFSIHNAEDFLDNQKLGKKGELTEFRVCVKYALRFPSFIPEHHLAKYITLFQF